MGSLATMHGLGRTCAFAIVLAGCKSKPVDDPMPGSVAIADARMMVDATKPWPELDGFPRTAATRVVALPVKPDVPAFDVAGPVIAGDVAVVASSQFGFLGIDWRAGKIAWTKAAGIRVAPPAVLANGNVVLFGDCITPPQIPDNEFLVGCLRVVTPTGTDLAYSAIRGKPKSMEAFVGARGAQGVWPAPDGRNARWRRGDAAIAIDLINGAAKPASTDAPVVEHRGKRWDIRHVEGRVVATVFDIDATGSLHGTVARPPPGIGVLARGTSAVGDAAIAVRVDASLRRDIIVGYAANVLLRWVYPLPERQRASPVGLALTADAVVVFHDGDTFTVLPELSPPPTTSGAPLRSSKNPTP